MTKPKKYLADAKPLAELKNLTMGNERKTCLQVGAW